MKLKQILSLAVLLIGISTANLANAQAKTHSKPELSHPVSGNQETLSTQVHNWAVSVSSILTLVGLSFAGLQYFQAEKWKRREYLDKKFQEFENMPETINVRKMLLNEVQLIELFSSAEKPQDRYALVTRHILIRALSKTNTEKFSKDMRRALESIEHDQKSCKEEEVLVDAAIRNNFNMFLQYLQQFEVMVQSQTVNRKDLETHLHPWIETIEYMSVNESCVACKEKLLEYIGLYAEVSEADLSPIQQRIRKLFTEGCNQKLERYQVHQKSRSLSLVTQKNAA